LDPKRVKYVVLSHAHGDHDEGAKLLQDAIPDVRVVYGAEVWDAADKSENCWAASRAVLCVRGT
jgi:metallo-beta-lactamase class B